MIKFFKYRKVSYTISAILILVSLFALISVKMNPGIEFTGGTIMEIHYSLERPETEEIRRALSFIGEVVVQPTEEDGFIIRMKSLSEEEYREVKEALPGATEKRFESIGPTIGDELKQKSLLSISLSSLAIALYITIIFSGASGGGVKSWQYGVIAAGLAFLHDVLIVFGFFVLFRIQITISIAVALLTVLGYSINDTVVIFDRIRENMTRYPRSEFSDIVDKSINETLSRSINTSVTTLLALVAVLLFGGETLKWFILAMIAGISIGTYSSVFLAGPLLVSWSKLKRN